MEWDFPGIRVNSFNRRKSSGFCYTNDVSADVEEYNEENTATPLCSPLSSTSTDVHGCTTEIDIHDTMDVEDREHDLEAGNASVTGINFIFFLMCRYQVCFLRGQDISLLEIIHQASILEL